MSTSEEYTKSKVVALNERLNDALQEIDHLKTINRHLEHALSELSAGDQSDKETATPTPI